MFWSNNNEKTNIVIGYSLYFLKLTSFIMIIKLVDFSGVSENASVGGTGWFLNDKCVTCNEI